ncbi:exonuclease SbcCD subunit D C-terminal domain-containing protein [Thiofilum flexile]|uniref:exonuclease SbcCD subunit D C-terminal domain-containing protein n=1 Tax=Thiofilum flexile TaxID=125627 RepID=UPI000373F2AF|nr:exonuclease SbcCD subunit D C-terminal domain-containing protein [Thiofilum flexile]
MKLLHTSDWHLGRLLYGKKRYSEFSAFLTWLITTIQAEEVEVLIVAGDIFDTTTPGNQAQELYYSFLRAVGNTCCRHVVITAGNHDSPAFLNAPSALLRCLNIYVVGAATPDWRDELITLCDAKGQPQALICAVPYLRDRDLRHAEAGETIEDKELKLLQGIQTHYAQLAELALQAQAQCSEPIPIIATGHLFTSGAQTAEGDGVRELYVGSLGHIPVSYFPACFDYVALGHLHVPQVVGGVATRRYSGSPLAMGFGEARQTKSVCVVEFGTAAPVVKLVPVPVFQVLEQVRGSLSVLQQRLADAVALQQSMWVEVIYEGEEVIGDLREQLELITAGSQVEILRIKNTRISDQVLQPLQLGESLDDLDTFEVFERCLQAHQVPESQWADLQLLYKEVVATLQQ